MKSQIVIARVKTEKDGKWICKFFLCGNHSGFFLKNLQAIEYKLWLSVMTKKITSISWKSSKEVFEFEFCVWKQGLLGGPCFVFANLKNS